MEKTIKTQGGSGLISLLIILIGITSVFTTSAEVLAVTGSHDTRNSEMSFSCPFSSEPNRVILDSKLLRSDIDKYGFKTKSVNLSAGNYKISAYTYDSYKKRVSTKPQQNESLYLTFQNGSSVIATSEKTPDIKDNVVVATWKGVINNRLSINQNIDTVVIHHSVYPSKKSPNSLHGCVAIDKIEDIDPLEVTCNVSHSTLDINQDVIFSSNVRGGEDPYTYSWSGAISGNNFAEVWNFNNDGYYTARVTVTDKNGRTAYDTCPTVVVKEEKKDFEITCNVSDRSIDEGDYAYFSVDVDGGDSPFDYRWGGDIKGEDNDNRNLRVKYNREGNYYVDVTVTDDDGRTRRDSCPVVRVKEEIYERDDFDIECKISDTSIDAGDRVKIEVDIDGGDSPFDIQWSGDDDEIDDFDDNDRSQWVTIDDEGRYRLKVEVEDDDGRTRRDTCRVIVVRDNDRNITVTNSTPTGTLAGLDSVYLSQIPYTGPLQDNWKVLGFISLLALWSMLIGMFFYKRHQKAQRSLAIQRFKESNRG